MQKKNIASTPVAYLQAHGLACAKNDAPVLLALSGGADSRLLLHLLSEECKECGAPLYTAHVNHMIRGAEAERDRDFCLALSREYGVECFLLEADVPALAKASGNSLEAEAREVRYSFFEKIMRDKGIGILATAHNADDNIETMLFNLARGGGIHGLCGIAPSRDFTVGKIVRPLINVSKADILNYCKENSLEFVFDSTNSDTEFSRNRIRSNILPELKKINSDCLSSALGTASLLREDAEYIDSEAEKFIAQNTPDGSVALTDLNSLPRALASRVIIKLSGAPLERCHVLDIIALAEKAVPHSSVSLPMKKRAIIENGHLVFEDDPGRDIPKTEDFSYPLSFGVNSFDGFTVEISHFTQTPPKNQKTVNNVYKKEMKAVISSDKIRGSLYVRNRRDGDTVYQNGMKKKLKKLMCDKKLPLSDRESLPIIADGNGILIVPFIAERDGLRDGSDLLEITVGFTK